MSPSESPLRVCVVEFTHVVPGMTWKWELAERRWSDVLTKLGELLAGAPANEDGDRLPPASVTLPPVQIRIEVRG